MSVGGSTAEKYFKMVHSNKGVKSCCLWLAAPWWRMTASGEHTCAEEDTYCLGILWPGVDQVSDLLIYFKLDDSDHVRDTFQPWNVICQQKALSKLTSQKLDVNQVCHFVEWLSVNLSRQLPVKTSESWNFYYSR